ncbi:NB-ARC domain-containing disease resistance protein, putative [Theobroma cacao]|uniref:NB-ARC domain-containing disease resistance protein, putative n=1 Tax=Theobroma cacao TaxID=3641 RepID=S1RU10_THECC|nr:NB-ARC domain-containing disease resistance protein, putative [Theobroma cacao]
MEAAIATGGAGNLVAEVVKYIATQFKRPVSYIFLHKRKVENFEEKVEMLTDRRQRVQNAVDVAERNMEIIEKDVQNWLIRVNRIINEEVKEVKDLEDKAKSKCFVGLCPNFRSHYLLSKKAGEDANTIDELLRQGEFNRVSCPAAPPDIVAASAKEFEAFDSRKKVFDEIVESLKDASINLVGVYGMGGVGKTTLVKEVARQVKEDKLFDSVVMAAVTQTPDIQKIQNQIADILGLKFDEQSMTGRACRLSERLKKETKILVVLDDIWARLDLEEVGIPLGDQQKGCKILLTSRDQDVLFNGMDAKKTFAIGVLEESEAWDLFKKMAGDTVENLELWSTAIKVAQKCAGLPVAITTVARSLRNKGLFAWNDALRKLQRPSPTNFTGIPAHVYSAIELSYNHLESEELKQTFLLCSLLGHHVAIQDLLKFTMGLGLKNEDVLKDWPDEDTMKMCSSISLCYASINELPDELKCPQLAFFHMGSKDASVRIPANFFKETKDLKVLDLTDMHLPSLPSSICLLTNLRTLCLDLCVLGDIAIIEGLKDLKVLCLIGSDIERLPREIARLTQLRLLDLHDCTQLKVIPPNVLSSLSRLEELYMGNSFVQWEAEGHANERSNASLAELKSLSRLTTLEVHIPDAKIMPSDLFFEKLERYNVFLEDKWNWFDANEYSRTLNLKLDSGIDDLDLGTKMLLKKAEDLHLHEMKGVKIGLNELEDGEGFPHLKNLHIQNGLEIQYIIHDNDAVDKVEFLQLRSLTLQDLPQLISFCSGNRRGFTSISPLEFPLFNEKLSEISYCFQNLIRLIIEDCGKLKRLLSSSMIRSLEHLKSFEISDCKCLREIIFTEDIEEENKSMVLFPRLNSLKIKSMQHLIGFCSENHSIEFPSLKLLEIEHCPQFKGFMYKSTMEDNQRCSTQALFDEKVAFPCLEKMTISHLRNLKVIWHS